MDRINQHAGVTWHSMVVEGKQSDQNHFGTVCLFLVGSLIGESNPGYGGEGTEADPLYHQGIPLFVIKLLTLSIQKYSFILQLED